MPLSTALLRIRVLVEGEEGNYTARSLDTHTLATAENVPALRTKFISALEEQLFRVARKRSHSGVFIVEVNPGLSRKFALASIGSAAEVVLRSEASSVVVFAQMKPAISGTGKK